MRQDGDDDGGSKLHVDRVSESMVGGILSGEKEISIKID